MICDEVVKDCIVKACCSEMCPEVRNLLEGNQRMVIQARAYAYGNMRKNEYCPVCHTQYFIYEFSRFSNDKHIVEKIKLVCKHCCAKYELVMECDGSDWRIDYTSFYKLITLGSKHILPNADVMKLEDIFKLVKSINDEAIPLYQD